MGDGGVLLFAKGKPTLRIEEGGGNQRLEFVLREWESVTMADDEIPDNVDLRFLTTQNARILRELGEMRELTKPIPQMGKDLSELQMTVAAMRTD
jgi:hypothetical protein